MALGAKMVPFAGWEMPVSYKSVVAEHQAVRNKAGIFDVSHMGRISIEGISASNVVDYLSTNTILGKGAGQATYTVWCNGEGGAIDDLIVYQESSEQFFIVANASNREKDYHHLKQYAQNCVVLPHYEEEGILAIQGPEAIELALPLFPELKQLKSMHFISTTFEGSPLYLAATGYTGEKGFEVYAPNAILPALWDRFLACGIVPVGLGARDTLRLEMGYALYGHELKEERPANESVAAWAIKLEKGDFLGKMALQELAKKGKTHFPAALLMQTEGIPREGYPVHSSGRRIGAITSGTFSPSLSKGIALALLDTSVPIGQNMEIEIREKYCPATVVKLPFWRKT